MSRTQNSSNAKNLHILRSPIRFSRLLAEKSYEQTAKTKRFQHGPRRYPPRHVLRRGSRFRLKKTITPKVVTKTQIVTKIRLQMLFLSTKCFVLGESWQMTDYFATSCPHCQHVKPDWDAATSEWGNKHYGDNVNWVRRKKIIST